MLGEDFEKVAKRLDREIEIVKHSDDRQGFEVLPKRWIVERTFGWLGKYRRRSEDYESHAASSLATIQIAMTSLMFHRPQPG